MLGNSLFCFKSVTFDSDKDVLFASVPAYASFKVYPGDFSLNNAKFSFVDTYQVRSVAPALTYLEGSAKLENGILSLAILPNEGIGNNTYATSLDVTMYGQYTSASYYFTVRFTILSNNCRIIIFILLISHDQSCRLKIFLKLSRCRCDCNRASVSQRNGEYSIWM